MYLLVPYRIGINNERIAVGRVAGRLEGIEKLEQLRVLEYGLPIRVVVTPYDSPEVDLPEYIPRIENLMKDRLA